jgi:hypothetical protein
MAKYLLTQSIWGRPYPDACPDRFHPPLRRRGDAGYIPEYKVERFCRDVRRLHVYEGTLPIQQLSSSPAA